VLPRERPLRFIERNMQESEVAITFPIAGENPGPHRPLRSEILPDAAAGFGE